ncbi:hypothetical protein Pmani_012160 [Petrolisthes manimaculis]|uniref:Uncharacterized protein n=1 Tax=Petrolisthes manimaculis TaxID=1843537 RepID=A0AAE1UFD1_9EUCA|nr:hypothetical protein Pmani_012160 [Petrolisthes manimaculis]
MCSGLGFCRTFAMSRSSSLYHPGKFFRLAEADEVDVDGLKPVIKVLCLVITTTLQVTARVCVSTSLPPLKHSSHLAAPPLSPTRKVLVRACRRVEVFIVGQRRRGQYGQRLALTRKDVGKRLLGEGETLRLSRDGYHTQPLPRPAGR